MSRIANATTELEEKEEIEVTPEMIKAGAAELASFSNFFDTFEEGALAIFRERSSRCPRLASM
jgi:hypothetical protein